MRYNKHNSGNFFFDWIYADFVQKERKSDKNQPGDFRVTEEVESVNLRERVRRVRSWGGGQRFLRGSPFIMGNEGRL